MKKVFCTLLLVAMLFCASFAVAQDIVMEKEIQNITFKKDKNGQDFARIIVTEPRTLNGVTYQKDVVIMAFGSAAAPLKAYRKGQTVKAVVSVGEYRGQPSYTILQVVK